MASVAGLARKGRDSSQAGAHRSSLWGASPRARGRSARWGPGSRWEAPPSGWRMAAGVTVRATVAAPKSFLQLVNPVLRAANIYLAVKGTAKRNLLSGPPFLQRAAPSLPRLSCEKQTVALGATPTRLRAGERGPQGHVRPPWPPVPAARNLISETGQETSPVSPLRHCSCAGSPCRSRRPGSVGGHSEGPGGPHTPRPGGWRARPHVTVTPSRQREWRRALL